GVGGPRMAAIEKTRPNERFADVGQNGGAVAPACVFLRGAEPDHRAKPDRPRHVRAGLSAHQFGKAPRQFTLVGPRKARKEHFGNDESQHVIAQKFEPLVAGGPVARPCQRRDMGERLIEQRRILEFISNAFSELFRGTTSPLYRFGLGGVWSGSRFRFGAGGWLPFRCWRGGFRSRFSGHFGGQGKLRRGGPPPPHPPPTPP